MKTTRGRKPFGRPPERHIPAGIRAHPHRAFPQLRPAVRGPRRTRQPGIESALRLRGPRRGGTTPGHVSIGLDSSDFPSHQLVLSEEDSPRLIVNLEGHDYIKSWKAQSRELAYYRSIEDGIVVIRLGS